MANTIQHKHRGIYPSTATPRPDDVDGFNWLEEHRLNAPEIGAVLVGDPSQSDGANWVIAGDPGFVLVTMGGGSLPVWQPASFDVVLTTPGDLARGRAVTGVAERLPVGTIRQLLVVENGMPEWRTVIPFALQGSMLWFSFDNTLAELPKGTPGHILTMVGIAPTWAAPLPSFGNPMTSLGDIIKGGVDGVAERLPIGTNGQVLAVAGGIPTWAPAPVSFVNPMTAYGDLIVGGVDGTPERLAIGGHEYLLSSLGGFPTWKPDAIPPGIVGSLLYYSDAPKTLGLILPGAPNQILTMTGGVPTWVTGSGGEGTPLPINQPGDLVIGDSLGLPARLGVGTAGMVLTATATGSKLVWALPPAGFENPMTALWDIIIGGAAGAPTRLPIGTFNYYLKSTGSGPTWAPLPPDVGFANPMTAIGDIITGSTAGQPVRTAVGGAGQFLGVSGGVPTWLTPTGFANPMTTQWDLIVGGVAGAAARLARGADGTVLTSLAGGTVAWTIPAFVNPMTSVGDIIRGGTAGAPTRLGAGTNGHVLTLASGIPAWAASTPMTTLGDIITGAASGVAQRLGVGAEEQVLTVVGGVPAWAEPTGGGVSFVTGEVTLPIGEVFPNATGSTNAPPQVVRRISTGTQVTNTPKVTDYVANFDATIFEALMASWVLPTDYVSGGELIIKFSMVSAITGNIRVRAGLMVSTDLTSDNRALLFNASDTLDNQSVPGTLGQAKEVTLMLTMTNAAAGKRVLFFIHLGTATTTNATGDRVLESWRFRYTAGAA